jgi:ABC-type dipeptide/oligopeptide/nickel transport system permease subunit
MSVVPTALVLIAGFFLKLNPSTMQLFIMTQSLAEILIAYAFVTALFVGLPIIVFAIVFLPGLMRTTGEKIGSSDRQQATLVVKSMTVPSRFWSISGASMQASPMVRRRSPTSPPFLCLPLWLQTKPSQSADIPRWEQGDQVNPRTTEDGGRASGSLAVGSHLT